MKSTLEEKMKYLKQEAESDMLETACMTTQIQMSHTMKDDMLNQKHITEVSWTHSI